LLRARKNEEQRQRFGEIGSGRASCDFPQHGKIRRERRDQRAEYDHNPG